jgi:hypothetical protein
MFGSAAGGGLRAKGATAVAALIVAALAAGVAVVLAGPAWAAILTVQTASDEQTTNGECSLREAVVNANQNSPSGFPDCPAGSGADTIGFAPSLAGQTIALASQLPPVTDGEGLTVDGKKSRIAISGNDAARVFEVGGDAELALRNLTLEKGSAHLGEGGAVLNRGHLTVDGSTFSGNNAGSGGAIANSGSATVKGSTLSGNTASGSGGGIHNQGTLAVTGSTLSGNTAASGGGVEHAGGPAVLRNTIVANSTSGGNCHAPASPITDGGYNLSSDDTCGFSKDNRSRLRIDPELGELDDNGGPSQTHALGVTSPAVDKGRSFGAAADQRGLPRPTDLGEFGNARGGDGSDIGAYEQVRCSGGVVNAAGTIVGTPGNDSGDRALTGTAGDDFIFGLGGNDRITGGGGNDEVCSGKGNDRIEGGGGDDTLLGGEGKDRLKGGDGDDCLEGLLGDDRLNTVDRVRANDEADGGSGQDVYTTDSKAEKARCRP